ncbi:MAG: branched-chain amino acid ABC transporter permease [Myxococcales bacterium]
MQTLQLLFSGLAQGMIYALLAFGYNITFSTSKTLNFALGNFLMMGGVLAFVLYGTHGLPFLATLGGVVAAGVVGGMVVQKVAIDPSLKTKSSYNWILATLAVGIILRNASEVFWSTDDFKLRSPLGDDPIRLAGVGVYPQELLIIGVSLAIVVGVETFKRGTIFGKAILAVSEDKDTASLMGINQALVIRFSFMLSTAIAAVAGLLVAPVTLVSATMGTVLAVKAYAVSIIGGLESGPGVLLGGILIGVSESLTARFISSGYKDIPGFLLLIAILLVRPSGIFGRRSIQKV